MHDFLRIWFFVVTIVLLVIVGVGALVGIMFIAALLLHWNIVLGSVIAFLFITFLAAIITYVLD